MTQQTNGMPDLNYSEGNFRDLYEACKAVDKARDYLEFRQAEILIEKAIAKAEISSSISKVSSYRR